MHSVPALGREPFVFYISEIYEVGLAQYGNKYLAAAHRHTDCKGFLRYVTVIICILLYSLVNPNIINLLFIICSALFQHLQHLLSTFTALCFTVAKTQQGFNVPKAKK